MAVNLIKPIWMQLVDIIEQHDLFCYPFDSVIFSVVCVLFSRTVPYNIMESTVKADIGAQCCKRGRRSFTFYTELIVITYSHIYKGEKKNCSLMTITNTKKSISTTTEHAVSFSSIARMELTRLPTHVKGA